MSDKEKTLVLEVKKVSAYSPLLPRHFSGNLKWCFYGFRFIYYNSTTLGYQISFTSMNCYKVIYISKHSFHFIRSRKCSSFMMMSQYCISSDRSVNKTVVAVVATIFVRLLGQLPLEYFDSIGSFCQLFGHRIHAFTA